MYRTLTPIEDRHLELEINHAGAWFIGSFMVEFVDHYEEFQKKHTKEQFIDYFYNEYYRNIGTKKDLRNRVNIAIRIIESGLVSDAMHHVLATNDSKIGCEESKINARLMLDCLKDGSSVLPEFYD